MKKKKKKKGVGWFVVPMGELKTRAGDYFLTNTIFSSKIWENV